MTLGFANTFNVLCACGARSSPSRSTPSASRSRGTSCTTNQNHSVEFDTTARGRVRRCRRKSPHDALIDLHQRRGCAQSLQVGVADVAGVQVQQTAPVKAPGQDRKLKLVTAAYVLTPWPVCNDAQQVKFLHFQVLGYRQTFDAMDLM